MALRQPGQDAVGGQPDDLAHAVSGYGQHGNRRVERQNPLRAFLRRACDGQVPFPKVRHSVQNRLVATALDQGIQLFGPAVNIGETVRFVLAVKRQPSPGRGPGRIAALVHRLDGKQGN
jgi:hypothetical protein